MEAKEPTRMGPKRIKGEKGGAWVVQLVDRPSLDFSSGLDLRVVSSSPTLGLKTKKKKKKYTQWV